jgi:lactate dehydrogenase-like 2-hydroxyacid dehydrogenase
MTADKTNVLLVGEARQHMYAGLQNAFEVHHVTDANGSNAALIDRLAPELRYIAVTQPGRVDAALMSRLPRLEIVASLGVGYENVDALHAGRHGIVVTNTPDVLNEEVADTALGLLLCTVRQFPQADRFVRAGKWPQGNYPLSHSLHDRVVGMVGMGRIGQAIARRLDAMCVPVVYHSRRAQWALPYPHYPKLLDMAAEADVLLVIIPGGKETRHIINAPVLDALGPDGILINVSRGSVVDEAALIEALQQRRILSAGLDVYADEPHVPAELLAMDHVVLFPHLGSASRHARRAMEQLVVDNLAAWHAGKAPLTPVVETSVPPERMPHRARRPRAPDGAMNASLGGR